MPSDSQPDLDLESFFNPAVGYPALRQGRQCGRTSTLSRAASASLMSKLAPDTTVPTDMPEVTESMSARERAAGVRIHARGMPTLGRIHTTQCAEGARSATLRVQLPKGGARYICLRWRISLTPETKQGHP